MLSRGFVLWFPLLLHRPNGQASPTGRAVREPVECARVAPSGASRCWAAPRMGAAPTPTAWVLRQMVGVPGRQSGLTAAPGSLNALGDPDLGVAFARIEVGGGVAALPTVEAVGACAARQRVVASAAAQHVVAAASAQCVIAVLPEQDVRAGCAGERVVAVAARLHRDGRRRTGLSVADGKRDGRAARRARRRW